MFNNTKNNRTELILNLVIEQYLDLGNPVSSKFISSEPSIKASPATVRNDMCMLEQNDMIYSPHTSAGRIPTLKGLRYFVDNILAAKNSQSLTPQKLSDSLGHSNDPEVMCEKAAKLIADMTNLTGFVVMPKTNNMIIRQLELVRLADRRLLCVLIDEHDHVKNRVVDLDEPVSEEVLQQTLQLLNTALSGFTMNEGAERLPYFIKQSDAEVYALVKKALFGDQVTTNEQYIFTSDEIRLLNPEISADTETLKKLITSFKDITPLMPMLNSCQYTDEVHVYIGEETGVDLLQNCTLIVKPFKKLNELAGYVAVVGPIRMDYTSVIPAVDITANILTSALNRD